MESASNGVHGSPADEIWGDSKWAEFCIYDLCAALGMDREATGACRRFTGGTDDFPRRWTRWFRDWFYPLWRDCGQAEVMNRFFRDLARHFPRDSGGTCTRRMNWGVYVHFTSGAAAADMSGQAARAFGWPPSGPTNWSTPARNSPASHTEIPDHATGPSFEPGRDAAVAEPTGTERMIATRLSFALITAYDCSCARFVALLTTDPQGLCP
ncbi:MAG: hypothetical protein ACLPN6_10605 [Streptosporangiaceae bacterium]